MGYCITQRENNFIIKADKKAAALTAMKKLGNERDNFHWVSASDFVHCETLEDALSAWRYEPTNDENDDIDTVQFIGEKLGDEFEMFKVIAPFVEKDSYIEMDGEDGTIWRWTFDGTECHEDYPTITWP